MSRLVTKTCTEPNAKEEQRAISDGNSAKDCSIFTRFNRRFKRSARPSKKTKG
jgi:hypothetical protein